MGGHGFRALKLIHDGDLGGVSTFMLEHSMQTSVMILVEEGSLDCWYMPHHIQKRRDIGLYHSTRYAIGYSGGVAVKEGVVLCGEGKMCITGPMHTREFK